MARVAPLGELENLGSRQGSQDGAALDVHASLLERAEPDGPVDLSTATPPAWRELDTFVIEAQSRRLNILMQAPVVGGNAGGPPGWAGRREPGKSAPADMEAAAAFAGKLARRYCARRHTQHCTGLGESVRRPRLGAGQ